MRVLVTGASGYVGWAVVHELRDRGYEVVALAQDPAGFPDDVEVKTVDLLDEAGLWKAVAGVDGVVHLAARTTVRDSAADPTGVWRVNVAGTLNLLDAMAAETERAGLAGRLVFASSAALYGTPKVQPIAEDTPPAPPNPYGASKAAAEDAVAWQAATGRLGAITLRLFNAAGAAAGRPDRDTSRIIPKAVEVAAGRAPVVGVNGDGGAVRDFVHVADIADAVATALDASVAGRHRVYNVGAVPASVAEIVAATERVTGRTVKVDHRPGHPGESRELRADIGRIQAELGWAPKRTTIEELIADQWSAVLG